MDITLVDYGDTQLTGETLAICSAVFDEMNFPDEKINYVHLDRKSDVEKLPIGTLILSFGAEAIPVLCNTDMPLKKYAGALTWNDALDSWVLPTMHPNRIYQGAYGDFDVTYDHIRRACDLATGSLALPPVEGVQIDWEFVGHNGLRGDALPEGAIGPRLPKGYGPNIWSGYFECTPEEEARQFAILNNWLHRLEVDGPITFGLDTESYTTNHFKPLTMIQVYDPQVEKAYAFTWGVIEKAKELWVKFFSHRNYRGTWHNVQHDSKMIRHWLGHWLTVEKDNDTMCWALGLTEKGNQTGLKYLSRQFMNAPFYEEALDGWLDRNNICYGHIRPDVLADYGCADVYYAEGLSRILVPLVQREGTEWNVRNILLPAAHTFAQMTYPGIRVDQELSKRLQGEWKPRIEAAIEKVQEYAKTTEFPKNPDVVSGQSYNEPCKQCVYTAWEPDLEGTRVLGYRKVLREKYGFDEPCDTCRKKRYVRKVDPTLNVRSWVQMHDLCFDVLKMEQTWEGRTTNKYFWEINQSHPFAELVMGYRQIDYLHRNILQGFEKFIYEDGRVHPNILLFGTKTGRLAIREPAMQTIPSNAATEEARHNVKEIKRLILPDEGDLLVNADYKNLEMFVAHHLTNDDNLLAALQQDIHTTTAAAMYMKLYEDINAEERQSAKGVVFGAGYNIKAKKLSRNKDVEKMIGGDIKKAQSFLDAFWNEYSTWNAVRKGWITEAFENCELTTELGRKRRWSLITKDTAWKVENQACNFKGQSLASDLCLTSLIRLNKELTVRGWGRVILTVHDSIVYSIHPTHLHEAVTLIRKIMTTPIFETKTPFSVAITVGPNYGDQYDYDPEKDYGQG